MKKLFKDLELGDIFAFDGEMITYMKDDDSLILPRMGGKEPRRYPITPEMENKEILIF